MSLDGLDLGTFPTQRPLSSPGYISPQQASQLLMRDDTWMMGNTTIYRRSALITAGGFPADLMAFTDGYVSRIVALQCGACFTPNELGYWRRDTQGIAGQTSGNLDKALEIAAIAVERMTHDHAAIFPRGYAERWRGRWLFGSLTQCGRPPHGSPTANLRRVLSPPSTFDRFLLSAFDLLDLRAWPIMVYAFLRLRPRDLRYVLMRHLNLLCFNTFITRKNINVRLVNTHFSFGHNWHSFSGLINEQRVKTAAESLTQLFGTQCLAGGRFLDIGSGSGIFSVAALRLNASAVRAIDIDPMSVRTTERTLQKFCPNKPWTCSVQSIFDMNPERDGTYDVVYSWGVLHHTGDMEGAIANASRLVTANGLLALGLYKKTSVCGFWRWEKRLYTRGPNWLATMIRIIYKSIYCIGLLITGRNPKKYIADYINNRGMDWDHDIHDWLGGYPYESISDAQMDSLAKNLGFRVQKRFSHRVPAAGLLGSLIVEYVLVRAALTKNN